jgi:hypothetical protein
MKGIPADMQSTPVIGAYAATAHEMGLDVFQ